MKSRSTLNGSVEQSITNSGCLPIIILWKVFKRCISNYPSSVYNMELYCRKWANTNIQAV